MRATRSSSAGLLFDKATLGGGYNPTGTITFDLFGRTTRHVPATDVLDERQRQRKRRLLLSPGYQPPFAGNYRWIANYSGDDNNEATHNLCNAANEDVIVEPAPSDATTAQSLIPNDSDPDRRRDADRRRDVRAPPGSCSGPCSTPGSGLSTQAECSDDDTLFAVTDEDTYYWKVIYPGDKNNEPNTNCEETFTLHN